MIVSTTERVIKYEGKVLADFNPTASVEDVVKMHVAAKPELASAHVEGPVIEDGKSVYTVQKRLGTKG